MPGQIDISVVGDTAGVERMLHHLETKLMPPNIAGFLMVKVAPYLNERAKNRFKNEGDDAVGRWAPLTKFTEDLRAYQGYGPAHPINKRTGRLENYITQTPSSIVVTPIGSELTLPGQPATGTLANKVKVAQRGGTQPGGIYRPTPARPVLGMNERDLLAVLTMLAHDIEGQP